MKGILLVLLYTLNPSRFEFTETEMAAWYIVNDGVMGGLSKGRVIATDDGVLFFGSVSLENNGGFTSFRSPYQSYDFSRAKYLTIRYRSEGMAMGLQLETYRRFYYPYFKVNLPVSNEWVELTINLEEIDQFRMGSNTGKKLTSNALDQIIRVGLVTNEKRAGDFKIEVDYVMFE